MSIRDAEFTTVLTLRLPIGTPHQSRRRMVIEGQAALAIAHILAQEPHAPLTVMPEEAPTTLKEAVDADIDDVLGGISPLCPICDDPLDGPHQTCEQRVMQYLAIA